MLSQSMNQSINILFAVVSISIFYVMKYGKISFSLPVALHFSCLDIFLLLSVMRLIMLICLLNVKPFPIVVHLCSVLVM